MSMLIHTHKKKDFTLVYWGDCCCRAHFSENLGFFIYARRLVNVGYQLLARRCGKRLIEIVVYQVFPLN